LTNQVFFLYNITVMYMKFNETKKVGLDIFFINIILLLFIYTKDGLSVFNLILAVSSSLIAVSLNVYYLLKYSKTNINRIFLALNIVVLVSMITLLIINII